MMLVEAHAQQIREGDAAFLRGLGGQLKGCRLCLDGIEVWRSKTYVDQTVGTTSTVRRMPDPDGFGWNCDANGNRVASQGIVGSAPDDMI
jgi:hypothetical protein